MKFIDKNPLVSIITPVYNGAKYLEELIQSVLNQDYKNIEHIIIDDGSTDEGATVDILKRYPHLRWWSRENKGQYATQNEGIKAAKGSILGIICADDMYITPSVISTLVNFWQSNPECGFVYGNSVPIDKYGNTLPIRKKIPTRRFPKFLLRYNLRISHNSLLVSNKIVKEQSILFDPFFQYAGDWDWIIRLSKTGYKFGYINYPITFTRHHTGQTTQTANSQAIYLEYRQVLQRYGANYFLFLIIRKYLNYRMMFLKGILSLHEGGISGLYKLIKEWISRKFSH